MSIPAPFDGPAWHTRLPLRWRVLMHDEPSTAIQRNLDVLRGCIAFDELRNEAALPRDKNPELARVELKVDIALDLLVSALTQSMQWPGEIECTLQRAGLAWRCDGDPPGAGARVALQIYLDPRYPRALELQVQTEPGAGPIAVGRFVGARDDELDGLETLIFRHHRRAVAQTRRRN